MAGVANGDVGRSDEALASSLTPTVPCGMAYPMVVVCSLLSISLSLASGNRPHDRLGWEDSSEDGGGGEKLEYSVGVSREGFGVSGGRK